MIRCSLLILAASFATAGAAQAQTTNPLIAETKSAYNAVKGYLTRAAKAMPDENYSFKPVDTVRSYGQIVGHVADAQYLFCSLSLGEKNPGLDIEHTKTSKAELIAAWGNINSNMNLISN